MRFNLFQSFVSFEGLWIPYAPELMEKEEFAGDAISLDPRLVLDLLPVSITN